MTNLPDQLRAWTKEGRYRDVRDAVEALPPGRQTPQLRFWLAAAYCGLAGAAPDEAGRGLSEKALALLEDLPSEETERAEEVEKAEMAERTEAAKAAEVTERDTLAGRLYMQLQRESEALPCLFRVLDRHPDDTRVSTWVAQCYSLLSEPLHLTPFRLRACAAWEAFAGEEAAFRAQLDQLSLPVSDDNSAGRQQAAARARDRAHLHTRCAELLRPALPDVSVILEKTGGRYVLTCAVDGTRPRLLLLDRFVRWAPDAVRAHWTVRVGRPPRAADAVGPDTIRFTNVQVWAEPFDDKTIRLSLYCPTLLPLLRQSEDTAQRLGRRLVEQVLGEVACLRYVADLHVLPAPFASPGFELEALPAYIATETDPAGWRDANDAATVCTDTVSYTVISASGGLDETLRADIVRGITCCRSLHNAYHMGASEPAQVLYRAGAVPLFFFWSTDPTAADDAPADAAENDLADTAGDAPADTAGNDLAGTADDAPADTVDAVPDEDPAAAPWAQIAQALLEQAGPDALTLLGGATGAVYQYLDCIAWDLPAVLRAAAQVFADQPMPWAAYHTFLPEAMDVGIKWESEQARRNELLVRQFYRWNAAGEFRRIIDAVEAIPEADRGYALSLWLAGAYSDLAILGSMTQTPDRDAETTATAEAAATAKTTATVETAAADEGREPPAPPDEGLLQKALYILRSIEEDGFNDPWWCARIAYVLFDLPGREAEAFSYASHWEEVDPDDPEAANLVDACAELLQAESAPTLYDDMDGDAVEEHIHTYFGPFETVFHERVSPDIHVDICLIPPTASRPFYTLVTEGMGAHRMRVPERLADKKLERAELLICLPADWRFDAASLQEERWYWPLRLLKSTARLPLRLDTWLGWGHTVSANDEDDTYDPSVRFSSVLLIDPESFSPDAAICRLPDGEEINFYQLIPLYPEELSFKLEHSAQALLDRFPADQLLTADPRRACAALPAAPAAPAGPGKDSPQTDEPAGRTAQKTGQTADSGDRTEDASPPPLATAMMAYLNCDCQYLPPMYDDGPIASAYRQALREADATQTCPVLIAVEERLWEAFLRNADPANASAPRLRFDMDTVLQYRWDQLLQPLPDARSLLMLPPTETPPAEDRQAAPIDPEVWPDRFYGCWDMITNKTEPLILARIPVQHPWEVFAHLPFGGRGACPDTTALMAVGKHWYRRYGAIPAVMTSSTLEWRLPAPVAPELVPEVAVEHCAFCPDLPYIVNSKGAPESLHYYLRTSDSWFFLWR